MNIAKVIVSTTPNSPSVVKTDRPGYLVDSYSSKSVIGRPVGSFSNIAETDRIIKEADNIEDAIAPSVQRLLLELPTNDDRLAVANFIIESYHDRNISVKTKSVLSSVQEYLLLSSNYFSVWDQ